MCVCCLHNINASDLCSVLVPSNVRTAAHPKNRKTKRSCNANTPHIGRIQPASTAHLLTTPWMLAPLVDHIHHVSLPMTGAKHRLKDSATKGEENIAASKIKKNNEIECHHHHPHSSRSNSSNNRWRRRGSTDHMDTKK